MPLLIEAVTPLSAVDVGCGLGHWLAVLKEHGVDDVLGYDGPWVDRSRLLIAPPSSRVADLNEPLMCERRFDIALCLEVTRSRGRSGPNHSSKRSWRFPMWSSFPLRSRDRAAFSTRTSSGRSTGPSCSRATGTSPRTPFRFRLWERDDVRWWFRQNMVCYSTLEALERHPALAETRCAGAPLPLVYPDLEQARSDAAEPQRAAALARATPLAQVFVRLHVEPHREERELAARDQQQRDEDDRRRRDLVPLSRRITSIAPSRRPTNVITRPSA